MRAVIAEDLALLRAGLERLLTAHDIEVVRTVSDGPSLVEALDGLEVRGDPRAYHLWLELPEGWRAEAFAAAAARRGISLTPGPAYAIGPGHAPAAVRLALASPTPEVLREALETLARLARTEPDQIAVD